MNTGPERGCHGEGTPQTQLVSLGSRRYTLHVCGRLAAGWVGSLARELSVRRISIERGWARTADVRRWEARFDLHALDPSLNLFEVDFLALARSAATARRASGVPHLEAYTLEHAADSIDVALRAPDGVGLLEGLLGTFASFALFPCEMTIDTRGGVAHDLFRLRPEDGGRPSGVVAASLEGGLRELSGRVRPPDVAGRE